MWFPDSLKNIDVCLTAYPQSQWINPFQFWLYEVINLMRFYNRNCGSMFYSYSVIQGNAHHYLAYAEDVFRTHCVPAKKSNFSENNLDPWQNIIKCRIYRNRHCKQIVLHYISPYPKRISLVMLWYLLVVYFLDSGWHINSIWICTNYHEQRSEKTALHSSI